MKRIAVVGGGMAGVAAAYELARCAREGAELEVVLFERSLRLGGIVETVREGGYVIECGPDGWVTEKPWALELARELGLDDEILASNDDQRKTYVLVGASGDHTGALQVMPDGMRMMVPTDLEALEASPLFSAEAKQAYRAEVERAAELQAAAPESDESVASFVRRHFGDEVLEKLGAPLLSGVFGGDVATLSVRAVMAPFVAMEQEYGSLITGLQRRRDRQQGAKSTVFTSLKSGTATLVERMVATIPPEWIRLGATVKTIGFDGERWTVRCSEGEPVRGGDQFDAVLLAAPVDVARSLLERVSAEAAALMAMEASSAVVVAFGFPDATKIPVPAGFGFLVPPVSSEGSHGKAGSMLLAATFVDQKYDCRVPAGGRLLRAFFGGAAAERLMGCRNDEIAALARMALARILGPLPDAEVTVVRRWPRSLPQYAVGHLERMAKLDKLVEQLPGLYLLGNGYRGVGLPDLIRDARRAVRSYVGS